MVITPTFKPPQWWRDIDRRVREGRFLEPYEDKWGYHSSEFTAIANAVTAGSKAHDGQVRKSNREPYVFHPLRSADSLRVRHGIHGPYLIVALILHDVIEDSDDLSLLDIEIDFDLLASHIVGGLTKPEVMGLEDYPDVRSKLKMLKVKAAGDTAILSKGRENTDNILTLPDDEGMHTRQLHETKRFIVPLTRREPQLYQDITEAVALRELYLKTRFAKTNQ